MPLPESPEPNTPAPETPDQTSVLAPLAELLPGWQQAFAAAEQDWHPGRRNHLRWQFGKEAAQAIDERAQAAPKTALMLGIKEALGCPSIALLYELVDVGRAFPDQLPPQRWNVLAKLARMDEKSRRRVLRKIPEWARGKDLQPFLPPADGHLPAKERATRAASQEADVLYRAADAAYEALKPYDKAEFLGLKLESFDPGTIEADARADAMQGLKQAAESIITAADAVLDGMNAPEPANAVTPEHHVN